MYEVRWAHTAVTDLRTKVRTAAVRGYLLAVAQTALDRPTGDWGARLDHDTWWRRGVAPEHEDDPDDAPGGLADGGREMPYDYVLVYLRELVVRMPRSFLVIRVYTNDELAAGLADGLAGHLPPGPARGRRLTRPRGGGGARR